MKYNKLGKSNIKVSEIGFGAWSIALDWWGKKISEEESNRMIKRAYDLGINFFETADMYGRGKSETLLGNALADVRSDIVLSTKYGYDFSNVTQVGHTELPQKFDADFTKNALNSSLERLRTDYVDVYGLHNPKIGHIRDDSIFDTLENLIDENRVRACQIALGPAIGWLQEGLESMSRSVISAVQTVYNILEQTPGNQLLNSGVENNVGILVRVPDASGILTGKVTADTKIDEKDHRSVRKGEWIKASLLKVEQLHTIADNNDLTITELAIKFILSKTGIASVFPTVISVEEIEQFVAISDGNYINSSDMSEIDKLFNSWPTYELKSSIT